jgi:hypothetical protein
MVACLDLEVSAKRNVTKEKWALQRGGAQIMSFMDSWWRKKKCSGDIRSRRGPRGKQRGQRPQRSRRGPRGSRGDKDLNEDAAVVPVLVWDFPKRENLMEHLN